ncbi:Target of Nesh-SH3 [Varanus komodoensis]|nr:Target of Nesh-SH3 [Varanus komodoensis]
MVDGKMNKLKPLQLVIGTLTPTSAFLSWGVLVNPKHDWTTMNNCANGRFYTVRYREKDKNKKWVLQLCPTTETVVDNLKPNTVYEFGVKDNTDNGIWSKSFSHKMAVPGKSKENGQLQNNIKLSKIPTFIPVDSKARIPITIIKQVLQNITHRAQSKSPEKFPVSGPIQVHIIIPDLSGTQQKLPSPVRLDISETPKKTLAQNESQEWPSESKTAEVQEISPQSYPAMTVLDWERSQPTAPSVSEESESSPASSEMQPVPSVPQTPAPKTTQTKPVYSKPQPAFSRATASDEIDLSDSKPVTNEPLEALTPKTSKALDQPRATLAPSETPFIPFKWEPSATPEGRHLKPVPSLPPLKQDTPKISRITEQLKSTPAPLETKFVPSTPKPFARPETPELKYEKEPQWESTTTSIYKTPELPRTTLAPSKTKIPVSKPQILPHLEEPKTVPAWIKLSFNCFGQECHKNRTHVIHMYYFSCIYLFISFLDCQIVKAFLVAFCFKNSYVRLSRGVFFFGWKSPAKGKEVVEGIILPQQLVVQKKLDNLPQNSVYIPDTIWQIQEDASFLA